MNLDSEITQIACSICKNHEETGLLRYNRAWLHLKYYFWAEMRLSFIWFIVLFLALITAGCANMVPPTGGKKDIKPPKLVKTAPLDSQLHIKPKKIELWFDEYITVSDANAQVQMSPILLVQPITTGLYKKVTVKLVDTLLQENTTYRISFGNSIKDLHENNPFIGYTYTFSTGGYFDSLQLSGTVLNAVTGLPDTGNVVVMLYNGTENDSAIVKKKPLYITTANNTGAFSFKGLPVRSFRIYASKDYNGNLIYDGPPEWIGFADEQVKAGDTAIAPVHIRIFQEDVDSSKKHTVDTTKINKGLAKTNSKSKVGFDYTLNADTSNLRSRTMEINKPIEISFTKLIASVNRDKITLSYDSSGVNVSASYEYKKDSIAKKIMLRPNWQENTVYTLKLLKGFAKDTSGADAMPSKYIFRTKRDEDYGKLYVHLSPKYSGNKYILLVKNDKDTIYNKPIADTMVSLVRLSPADYSAFIIVDANGNGKWDAGKLFDKIQPEEVIPYGAPVPLKAGWENTIDMIPVEKTKQKTVNDLNKTSK